MVEVPFSKNEIRYDDPIVAGDRVVITGIINEKCFYVRRSTVEFGPLLTKIHQSFEKAIKLKQLPEVDDLVLANYMGEVYRSKVLETSDETISIRLIDYGNTAQVKLSDLKAMDSSCQKLTCFTHKVILNNVKIPAINESIVEFLDDILLKRSELLVKNSKGMKLELVVESTNTNVNNAIMDLAEIPTGSYHEPGFLVKH